MSAPRESSCTVRGMAAADGRVRLVTRNLSLEAEGQTSLASDAKLPSALDLLVSAFVTDLLAGLQREAARDGVSLNDAELNVSAALDNPLVALGVIGETGSPALAELRGTLYVSGQADAGVLARIWQRALERAPVYATLRRVSEIHVAFTTVT